MSLRTPTLALLAVALMTVSCADGTFTPSTGKLDTTPRMLINPAADGVRISEIHYDNTGTDAGEAIEVSAPVTTDLTGWRIYLYNGAGGAVYDNDLLPTSPETVCGDRKVVVLTYPSNGIQNGAPDGIALVDPNGVVVEFLSYEGVMTGVGGPADGITSTDIGVQQNGNEPLGHTLQRTSAANTWITAAPDAPGKFGECNDNGPPPPDEEVVSVTVAPSEATIQQGAGQQFSAQAFDAEGDPIANVTFTWSSTAESIATVNPTGLATGVMPGTTTIIATAPNNVTGTASLTVTEPTPPADLPPVRFSEIHYDNFGTDIGEAIEIEGPAGTNLDGWSVLLYNGNGGRVYSTRALSGVITATCANLPGRGIVYLEYPTDGIQNGAPDGMALVDAEGNVVEFLSYEGVMSAVDGRAAGMASQDIGVSQTSAPFGQTLQRNIDGSWSGPIASTIGGCNSGGPIERSKIFSFTGRLPADPALPVGFEDQLFVNVIDPTTGDTLDSEITWTSLTPDIASIDQDGVLRALAAGTATVRATATIDGSSGTYSLPTRVATASASAQYGNHIEFGAPADGDNSDDYIVVRPQFIASFNGNKGIPNWAAYNLDATHFGSEDRCDCFTYDPELPFTRYTTADYTGAGAFHGYGIDRGHLVRSFDREAGSLDNATTFYFSNIVPQAADNNQGPWAAFENFLGAFAQAGDREVYIVAGASGSKGTVKDEGIITIPAHMWKVALVLPRNQGLSHVDSFDDVEVYAVIMPNEPGIRSTPWQNFQVTVDDVEALSGYNLLALLPDHIEIAVESGTQPPVAATNGPFTLNEGGTAQMSASASSDADGHALTYAWSFGDGATATGAEVSHTYTQDGAYTVRLVVTDVLGLADTVVTTATVANVAPEISALPNAMLLPHETYQANGSFTDPGADSWSATVNYGDGSGNMALALNGKTFALAHTYSAAGTFTVTVAVSDDDVTATRNATVTVLSYAQALDQASALIEQLRTSGALNNGNANALQSKVDSAQASVAGGNHGAAANQLSALLNQLQAFVQSGKLTDAQAEGLRSLVSRTIASLRE